MFTHLEAHHGSAYEKMMQQHADVETRRDERRKRKRSGDGLKQFKLTGNNNNVLTLNNKLDPKLQARWDASVVKFVSETGISFFACEKLGILLEAIWPQGRPRLIARSQWTVSRHVAERSLSLKVDLYSILVSAAQEENDFPGIAFTTDMWRSRALDSYMALTAHFINKQMKLVKIVPFVEYFGQNRHTGCNIMLFMDQFMKAIGMDGDHITKTVVCDNASNNKVMLRISSGFQEYYCNIHTMQLAINEVFQLSVIAIKVDEVMDKCKKLAKFVRRSEANKNQLKNACKETGINFSMPKLPNDTRWNSKEANVATTIKLKSALQWITQTDTSLRWSDVIPNAAEFTILESLVEILERVKVANKIWEGDLNPTIQTVITELYNIKDTLKKKMRNRERYISVFARELNNLIEQRFPKCGSQNTLNCLAHFLDPEYKGVILKQFGVYNKTKEDLKKIGAKYEDVDPPPPPVVEAVRSNSAENDNLSAAQRLKLQETVPGGGETTRANNVTSIELELEKYESMNIPSCNNLLLFWRDHSSVFPILTNIAREIFAIPASSASSERVFSVGTLVRV